MPSCLRVHVCVCLCAQGERDDHVLVHVEAKGNEGRGEQQLQLAPLNQMPVPSCVQVCGVCVCVQHSKGVRREKRCANQVAHPCAICQRAVGRKSGGARKAVQDWGARQEQYTTVDTTEGRSSGGAGRDVQDWGVQGTRKVGQASRTGVKASGVRALSPNPYPYPNPNSNPNLNSNLNPWRPERLGGVREWTARRQTAEQALTHTMTRAATHHAREGCQEDAEQVRPCLKRVEIQVEGEAHAPGQDHAERDDQHRNLWGVCVMGELR